MKKVLLFVALLFASNLVWPQWEPDVRLTNDPGTSWTSYNNARCIAASGDTLHVVWEDDRDGHFEVYYKRSTDGGITWGTDTRLTNLFNSSQEPSIVVDGPVVHIFWFYDFNGNDEIYYKRSSDGGNTWGTDTRLTNALSYSYEVSATISGSILHIVWVDFRDGNGDDEIYYKRSIDGGLTWDTDIRLTDDAAYSGMPCVSASGSVVHVVWEDNRDTNGEIYYKRSTDGGITWGSDTRLTNANAGSWNPCISVVDSLIHVVWWDERNSGTVEIYYKRSTDGGITWGADTRMTNSTGDASFPSIAAVGFNVHIVWYDDRNVNEEIYYQHSEDAGLSWDATDTRLTNSAGYSEYPSIAISDSTVHVAWMDFRDGNDEIYYKRNPTGNPIVGIENYLAGNSGQQFSIYPNPASKVLNITFTSEYSEKIIIRLIDMTGRTIGIYNFNSSKGLNHYAIELKDHSNGLYFIEFTTGGKKHFGKLLISK